MDFLKEVFGEDALTFEQLSEKLSAANIRLANLESGRYVEKDRYDGRVAELNKANETIASLQETVKKFDGKDPEAFKQEINDLKVNHDQEMKTLRNDHALDMMLVGAKAKNIRAVRSLLDTNKLVFEENRIIGLDEQIAALKESDGYLFEGTDPSNKPIVSSGAEHKPDTPSTDPLIAGLEKGSGINLKG